MSQTTEEQQSQNDQSPAHASWSQEPWNRVKQTIQNRWSHVGDEEIQSLPCNVYAVIDFLDEFTETSREEIEAIVGEVAPEPTLRQRASHVTHQVSEQFAPAWRSVSERAEYELHEHPATLTGFAFVAGVAIGVLGTLAYCQPHRKPETWTSYLKDRW